MKAVQRRRRYLRLAFLAAVALFVAGHSNHYRQRKLPQGQRRDEQKGSTFVSSQVSDTRVRPVVSCTHSASPTDSPLKRGSHCYVRASSRESEASEAVRAEDTAPRLSRPLGWLLFGVSLTFLAHFASMYVQLPGLFDISGIEPIASRPRDIAETYLLQFFASPEVGLEILTFAGLLISFVQVVLQGEALRTGPFGAAAYVALFVLWHDLYIAGGRFTQYQMDALLLDITPLCVVASLGASEFAALFGLRWLFMRLYIGGGSVKLLSCDESWRDLTALHWHFQSQPLPNPVGILAHVHLPDALTAASTLMALLVEITVPYLALAPSLTLRQLAFAGHALLQVGIMLTGNYGTFNALSLVLGLSLLSDADLPPAPGTSAVKAPSLALPRGSELAWLADSYAVLFAIGAAAWTAHNVQASCNDAWDAAALVYAAILYVPLALVTSAPSLRAAGLAVLLILGSCLPFARGLGVPLPVPSALLAPLQVGSTSYGLFARMTGIGGRPTVLLEASTSRAGPWIVVPFRYQAMETDRIPPLCFPHFPRLDWTYWFTSLDTQDGNLRGWLGRFLLGITTGDRGVWSLLDAEKMANAFPTGPPEYMRLSPSTYRAVLPTSSNGMSWWERSSADVANEPAWEWIPPESFLAKPVVVDRASLRSLVGSVDDAWPSGRWPTTPLRSVADGSGETFIWAVLLLAAVFLQESETAEQHDQRSRTQNADVFTPDGLGAELAQTQPSSDSSTSQLPDRVSVSSSSRWVVVRSAIEISGVSAEDAYRLYANLENHPLWALWLSSVSQDDSDGSSRWLLRVLGLSLRWTARIETAEPPRCYAWESIKGIKCKGVATFEDCVVDQRKGTAMTLALALRVPYFVKRVFDWLPFSGMSFVERTVERDLKRFRAVVLDRAAGLRSAPVLDTQHTDRFGSCRVVVNTSGLVEVVFNGFGTSDCTRQTVEDLSAALEHVQKDLCCIIDMTSGTGCSPLAMPHIVRFLRLKGSRFFAIAILAPRQLVVLAQVAAKLGGQQGIAFFKTSTEAKEWLQEKELDLLRQGN